MISYNVLLLDVVQFNTLYSVQCIYTQYSEQSMHYIVNGKDQHQLNCSVCKVYIINYTLVYVYSVYNYQNLFLYSIQNDLIIHAVKCILYNDKVYAVQCTLYTVHCTLYNDKVYSVHCTLYTVHCTVYTIVQYIVLQQLNTIPYTQIRSRIQTVQYVDWWLL